MSARRFPTKMRRLLRMGPAEVAGRTRHELRKWVERVSGREATAAREPELERLASVVLGGGFPAFAGASDPSTTEILWQRMPAACDETVAAADKLLTGRFDLLGYRDLCFGDPVDWHLDVVSGRRAPRVHWSRLDPLDVGRVGDAKVTWELNRHQWMVTLAQAYALRHDGRYAQHVLDQMEAWIADNPVGQGINWTSSLEVAYRLIAWCWAIQLVRTSPALDRPRLAGLLRVLAAHAARVERYLSYHYSPNTHLIGEALGLIYAGVALAGLERAARWRRLGEAILTQEIERQVLPDGVYFEQSTSYQRYAADIYLHWMLLAVRAGVDVPPQVTARVARMLDFLLAVRRPDGGLPAFGDADGGWLLPLARRKPDDASALFSTAAALFRRPDYAWAAGGLAPETVWLLGAGAAGALQSLRPVPPERRPSAIFPRGGWAVLRDGWEPSANQLLFDVGPLGCPVSSGHGHADLLSLQGCFFGEPIIVDAGTYSYADPEWRNVFRSTFVHNTITLDGLPQAEPDGPFSWKRRPRARLERWVSREDFDLVSASHGAYDEGGRPVCHRRTVFFARRQHFVVIDELEGTAEHLIELRFQLAPGASVYRDGPWLRIVGRGGHGVDLRPFAPVPLNVRVHEGELTPRRGWVSLDYGRMVPAPLVVVSARAPLPLCIVTTLLPRAVAGPCVASLE